MALLNEILVGRYNRFVQKLLSMKGRASLVQLRSEMGVEIPLFHGTENRYLEAWDVFGVAQGQAAGGGGTFAKVMIRNPIGSNVVGVLTHASAFTSVADSPTLTILWGGIADQATVTTLPGIDNRSGVGSTAGSNTGRNSALILSSGTVANVATTSQTYRQGNFGVNGFATLLAAGEEIPILPNTAVVIATAIAATSLTANLAWRERFLEDSERK